MFVFGGLRAEHGLGGAEGTVFWGWGGSFPGLLRRQYLVAIILISMRSQRDDILPRSIPLGNSKPTH
jgi:hypothetical protein